MKQGENILKVVFKEFYLYFHPCFPHTKLSDKNDWLKLKYLYIFVNIWIILLSQLISHLCYAFILVLLISLACNHLLGPPSVGCGHKIVIWEDMSYGGHVFPG